MFVFRPLDRNSSSNESSVSPITENTMHGGPIPRCFRHCREDIACGNTANRYKHAPQLSF